MPGKIKSTIDNIIRQRSQGKESLVPFTRAKLILKGIDPSMYTEYSPDDEVVLEKLITIAKEWGLTPPA